jgi:hypothetical protein
MFPNDPLLRSPDILGLKRGCGDPLRVKQTCWPWVRPGDFVRELFDQFTRFCARLRH